MSDGGLSGRIWYALSPAERAARALLAPFGALYGAATAVRGALYDAGILPAHAGRIAAVSIGNLTVGGTGKTPIAAWLAGEFLSRGAHPAIVLRGYGADEPLVHQRLNPEVPVIVDADRVRGVARAVAAGADIAVLDDAFQHRRAAREADIVLVSADQWPERARILPAGPFREPLSALRRASLVLITRKAAADGAVERVRAAVEAAAPNVPMAVARLSLGPLHASDDSPPRPLESLRGQRVLAISGVGDPAAFIAQLESGGARVRARSFGDHHRYNFGEAGQLAAYLAAAEMPICTLKDFVKLAPVWPRQAPALWYVSQRSAVEEGRDALDALIDSLLRARIAHP
jgi:tetraacyldisaccharide 4'-kinase